MSMPTVAVPASKLFCHPSHLANTYEPGVEWVHQEAFSIPGENVVLSIKQRTTLSYTQQVALGWRGRLASRYEAFRRGACIDLKEQLVYDARAVFNGNMAHLVQHHVANLGYVKERLGYGPGEVLVILEGRPADMAVQVFSLLGYDVLKTYSAVKANLVEISLDNFFHLLPFVRHLEVDWRVADGPRKIFIPRKQSRRLTNEAEVESLLCARGFEKVYFEDIPIIEQWSIMRNADHVVAIHGAALGCLPFQASRRDGGHVRLAELFSSGFVVNPFRKFVAVLGGEWVGCRGRITPDVARDIDVPGKAKAHAFDDFELSAQVVELALKSLEGQAAAHSPCVRAKQS